MAKPRYRGEFVATLLLSLLVIPAFLFPWGKQAELLRSLIMHPFLYGLFAAGLVMLVRKFVLRRAPRPVLVLLTLFVLSALTTAWVLKHSARPTLLSFLLVLFIETWFLAVAYDPVAQQIKTWLADERFHWLRNPWAQLVIALLVLVNLIHYLPPVMTNPVQHVVLSYLYFFFFLLPAATAFYRFIVHDKPAKYVEGVALTTFLAGWPLLGAVPSSLGLEWFVAGLLTAGWIHLFFDGPSRAVSIPASEEKSREGARPAVSGSVVGSAVPSSPLVPDAWVAKLKERRTAIVVLVIAALAAFGLYEIIPKIYRHFVITVVELTPSGEVRDRATIRVVFSEAVKPISGSAEGLDCFVIEPALPGFYRQENEKTIVYVPTVALSPSTRYHVRFSAKKLTGAGQGKRVEASEETTFNTPLFKVVNTRLFYTYDIITNEEHEVTGEINFNYPVALESLRANLQVIGADGKPLLFEIERSNRPTRFYVKANGIGRQEKEQKVVLKLAKGLGCINGTVGLEEDYSDALAVPAKMKFDVSEVKIHHEPGNTLVALQFNMPVSADMIRRYVHLEPAVGVEVETEYCYAVLRGKFKPNQNYKVVVATGMISVSGQKLENKVERWVQINDLPPSVRFARRGHILSLKGPKTLEVQTMNLDTVNVRIEKVFRNNLIQFIRSGATYSAMSRSMFSGSYQVEEGQINEEVTQHINLAKLQEAPYKGLFFISLTDSNGGSYHSGYGEGEEGEGEYYSDAGDSNAWFLCTDLGLIAKHSGEDLVVYSYSIDSLTPQSGVSVELVSDDNQVIDKQQTDGNGRVVFTNYQKNEFNFRPLFLVAKKDDDFSFLEFNRTALNQHQFAVGGDPYSSEGVEAFVTPERGVYRPGETAHITAIVRSADGAVPPVMPVKVSVTDPQRNEIQRAEIRFNENAVLTFDVPFPGDAMTGEYHVTLRNVTDDTPIGSVNMKVEEFIPDKLKVDVDVSSAAVQPGQMVTFAVRARQLFGPPAPGHKVVTVVRFMSRRFAPLEYSAFTFEDETRPSTDEEMNLGEDKLDDQGRKEYSVEVPRITPRSALSAYLYTEVFDTGGRPVSAAQTVLIHPYTHYLGVRRVETTPAVAGGPVTLEYVALTPDGKPVALPKAQLVVKRKAWYSIFRRGSWGRSGYSSASYEELISNKEIAVNGKGTYVFTPKTAGDYTVILISPNGMRTTLSVNVSGPGYATQSLESPEKLKLVLDKDDYEVGETAHVSIKAPFPGRLFLSIEREKVLESIVVKVTGAEQTFSFPITEKFLPNVYVSGLLVRAPGEENKTLPMTSFGITPMTIKNTSRRINLRWTVADDVQSADGIDVDLKVDGDAARTDVVLAAVDTGILQITNFATPNPLAYFYRKRSLTTQTYTILNLVLPDVFAQKFAIGGDEGEGFSRRHLNPVAAKRKKPMALFSGILRPDAEGHVRYKFPTAGFNGEVRVMALAVRGRHYGSSDHKVKVADPIVVIPSFPRFAAPGDQFQIPALIYNKTGKETDIKVSLTASGPVRVTKDPVQTIHLSNEHQQRLLFFVEAVNDAGVAKFSLAAEGAGFRSVVDEELSVRPAAHLVSVGSADRIKPGSSSKTKVPAGFIPFGQRISLSLSGNPLIRYLGSVDYLIRYPYGCAEQTTSGIFPMVFLKDLGFATGRFGERANAIDLYMEEGMKRLETMRTQGGGLFSMWPGGGESYRWLDQYVSHCLIEADRHGFKVPPYLMSSVKTFVRGTSAMHVDTGRLDRRNQNTHQGEVDAYQLYLKALINEPDRESMAYLLSTQLKTLGETDRAFLSAAYSQIGDRATGLKVLTPDFKSHFLYREQYGSFNSPVRNTAMYLWALAQADPGSPKVFEIVEYLGGLMQDGRYGTTQENVWALLAFDRVYSVTDTTLQAELLVDGKPYKTLEGREHSFVDNSLSGKIVEIRNTGPRDLYFSLLAEGTPLEKGTKSSSKGISVERHYLATDGSDANLSNIAQGDLVVVALNVKADKDANNVVIVDLLPAGFEIENPRLRSRGQLGFDPQITFTPASQDIRDDRLLLFSGALGGGGQMFAYTVRAVTPGRFVIPNAYAEAMYDPEIHGEAVETKTLTVADNNAQ